MYSNDDLSLIPEWFFIEILLYLPIISIENETSKYRISSCIDTPSIDYESAHH